MSEFLAPQDDPDSAPSAEREYRLQVVRGYYELGMYDDALTELEEVEAEFEASSESLQMRVLLLLREGEFEKAMGMSEQLREIAPESCAGFIHGAYCLHELRRTEEALQLLLKGPECLRDEAIYFYNLGCYQAALGEIDDAREQLHRSFDLDRRLRAVARKDPDLEILRDTL